MRGQNIVASPPNPQGNHCFLLGHENKKVSMKIKKVLTEIGPTSVIVKEECEEELDPWTRTSIP